MYMRTNVRAVIFLFVVEFRGTLLNKGGHAFLPVHLKIIKKKNYAIAEK